MNLRHLKGLGRGLAATGVALAWPMSTGATVFYENGVSRIDTGLESVLGSPMSVISAEDFVLSSQATIDRVQWTGSYFYSGFNPETEGPFTIAVDRSGPSGLPLNLAPSSQTYLSIIGSVARTRCGVIGDNPLFCYSASVVPVTLSADSLYWLSIASGPLSTSNGTWVWAGQQDTGNAIQRNGSSAWDQTDARLDFQLSGSSVPEPGTLLLLTLGLVGVGVMRLRIPADTNKRAGHSLEASSPAGP